VRASSLGCYTPNWNARAGLREPYIREPLRLLPVSRRSLGDVQAFTSLRVVISRNGLVRLRDFLTCAGSRTCRKNRKVAV